MQPRLLLALAMIVKDEAPGIEATLASVRERIDRWTILDTGSTDGTQEKVLRALEGVPGELHEEPFVDFATTRNRALALADAHARFVLMLSGDETVEGADALRAFCAARRDDPEDAAYLRVRMATLDYDSVRLTRAGSAWRYEGETHERLAHPDGRLPSVRVPGCLVHHGFRFDKNPLLRWRKDLEILDAAIARNPRDARGVFYRAQTLACLGMYPEAIEGYRARLGMVGAEEELYEASFRLGGLLEKVGASAAEVDRAFLAAHVRGSGRAEPLYEIARRALDRGEFARARDFAEHGARMAWPEGLRLFVHRHVYDGECVRIATDAAQKMGHAPVRS
jgi:tetratricopeptide (TPR) repeat protein